MLKTRHKDGVAIIDVSGTVRFGPEANQFHNTIIEVFEKGNPKILLNLAALDRFDSSGLGSLVSAYASITRREGALKLLNPGHRVADLLKITNTAGLFEIFTDEATALSSFSPAR